MASKSFQQYDVVTAATKWSANGTANGNGKATHANDTGNGKQITPDIESIFGKLTFGTEMMRERLPKKVYKSLRATIDKGEKLDPAVADVVAEELKKWATENGASHFTHWFQPLTGSTAEKHDSFVTPNRGGGAVYKFSGKELIQGEPDASSFPSGGLRATFEARGYTAWDPTSPAFLVRNKNGATLCIPTAFASWTGDALDHKTPLLRSIEALNNAALKALKLFDVEAGKVYATVGNEQEYFLIDQEFYYRRPDLLNCGRTLFGAQPPRGQEMEDHYFGSIPERVLAYMTDVEYQLYELGVPVKTRHNEVAPGQYEIAPIYEHGNVAADHQHLVMQTLRNTAQRYGLVCLLHEKPFEGINGSGKHNNWSMSTDTGLNLLEPGDTPESNKLFLFFCAAVIKAVDKHQDLLRACVASAGNDHRLGANEAPPAIMSIFLGDQLSAIFAQIQNGKNAKSERGGLLGLGTDVLPPIPKHAGDRNRTSPFAFTGNKFEFRAVGSSQSVSFVNTVLNTITAEAIREMTEMVAAHMQKDNTPRERALGKVLKEVLDSHGRIIFDGDGYSEEWQKEAEKRGLLNLRTSVEAFATLTDNKNLELFRDFGVLNEREARARKEIYLDQYVKTVEIEAESTASIVQRLLLPASIRYVNELAQTVNNLKAGKVNAEGVGSTLATAADLVADLRKKLDELLAAMAHEKGATAMEHARYMRDAVIPAMNAVRMVSDLLEQIVPDDLWPLPSYQEMLFIK